MKKPFYKITYVQVLVAIVIGVLLGAYRPELAQKMEPLGIGFINLIKMIIGPVIFCTVTSGIAGMSSMKKLGRVGGKALLYFEVVSTFALILGLIIGNVVQPGAGVQPTAGDPSKVAKFLHPDKPFTWASFILDIIPNTLVSAFTNHDSILQVLFVAILFGIMLAHLGPKAERITILIDDLSKVIFGIVNIVMKAAPIGAFGAMAFTVGSLGVGILLNLLELVGTFYATSLLFVFVILGIVAKILGFSIFRYLAYIKQELFLILGTSSSESAFPNLIIKLEKLGCEKSVVSLVVPAGYSFNLDGTNIYMTLAILFLAQATHVNLDIWQQLGILVAAMAFSKGATGVTGAGFITLALTLQAVPGISPESIILIYPIDRFMSECRALTNFIGNGIATIVVCAWEGNLDKATLLAELSGRTNASKEAATT